MVILGIDPGTATTGYGIVEYSEDKIIARKFDLIETNKDGSPSKRLMYIHSELVKLIALHKPDVFVMEKLFFATNAKTAIRVGQAQGVMLLSAAEANLPVFEYAPGTIKKMVAGNGRADKKDIQRSLRKVFGAKVKSKAKKKTHFDNAADALAVSLCHIYTLKGGDKIER